MLTPGEFGPKVQQLATATTPLLVRGMLESDLPGWRAQAARLSSPQLGKEFGDVRMNLSVGKLLSHGPESTRLDTKKLKFMQKASAEPFLAPGPGALRRPEAFLQLHKPTRAGPPLWSRT